ncbi:MAG: hypothetical protein ACLT0Y_02220 [Christensenellales bacterium]
MGSKKQYYRAWTLGSSVGYAATNEAYQLMKFRGEPVWGVTTFEAASWQRNGGCFVRPAALDRRKQRVQMINEIFAPEICQIDPHFLSGEKRRAFKEDTQYGVQIFDGGISTRSIMKNIPRLII